MRFTKEQYLVAIKNLQDGMKQLEPDGNHCSICTDTGHQAFECGHNPLVAMALCESIAKDGKQLADKFLVTGEYSLTDKNLIREKFTEILDYLRGQQLRMGEPIGPATVKLPPENGKVSWLTDNGTKRVTVNLITDEVTHDGTKKL